MLLSTGIIKCVKSCCKMVPKSLWLTWLYSAVKTTMALFEACWHDTWMTLSVEEQWTFNRKSSARSDQLSAWVANMGKKTRLSLTMVSSCLVLKKAYNFNNKITSTTYIRFILRNLGCCSVT